MTIKPYKIKIGDHEELVNATDGTHAGRIASDMLVRERWKDAHQTRPFTENGQVVPGSAKTIGEAKRKK
jgi:hypothetical protein